MRFDIENRLLLKLMTFIPPLLGIVIFSYIVKFSHNTNVPERLAIYQGISAFFSLILIGFIYIKDRHAISGIKISLIFLLILIAPIIAYYFAKVDLTVVIMMTVLSFSSSAILYLLLVKGKMFYYLFYSIVNSVVLPFALMVNYYYFISLIIVIISLLVFVYFITQKQLTPFSFKDEGIGVINSIFLHSPFILLPFFDFVIQSAIGAKHYGDYVLLNKYINGGITLLFSYKQLNLMFSGELKKMKLIIRSLIIILGVSVFGIFSTHYFVFAAMIVLYSLGVNMSSLIIRNQLMNGIYFRDSLIGLVFVCVYVFGIKFFKVQISENNHIFVLLMTIATVLPSLLLNFNTRRRDE